MCDKYSLLPACGKYDSFFSRLSASTVISILRCMCVTNKQKSEDQWNVVELDTTKLFQKLRVRNPSDVMVVVENADQVRQFQLEFFDQIAANPDAHKFVLSGKTQGF